MSVSYRREMNHNYMIIDSLGQDADGYECKMLSGNTIEGLLKFRVSHQEEKNEFFYEITSKQPLSRILTQRMITGGEIKSLLLSLAGTLGKIEEYLLREEQIMLEPDYIYIEPDRFAVYLCIVPGYICDFAERLTALLAYLVGKINHQDSEGVVLAYNLYHESLKDNYGLSDLLVYLRPGKENIFQGERPEKTREVNKEAETMKAINTELDFTGIDKFDMAEGADSNWSLKQSDRYFQDEKSQGLKSKIEKKELEENSDKKNKLKKIIYQLLSHVFMVLAAEMALWLFMGEAGLLQYGIFAGAAVFLTAAVISGFRTGHSIRKQGENSKRILVSGKDEKCKNPQRYAQERQDWKIELEEKADKDWTDWLESDNIGECVSTIMEPETALLTPGGISSGIAVMESLIRERENIKIAYLPFVIGKHAEMADYCLHQPTVSRLHLRIDKKENVYIVTDLNSTNGTTVEGYHLQANETVSIKNGDTIYMADAGYRFLTADNI